MKTKVKKEVEKLIEKEHLNCKIIEFKDKVDWENISLSQKLSEDFIREFKDKVYWHMICRSQKLSEDFIREFKDKVDWFFISTYQDLSEDFIREFKDNIYWNVISIYQKLSEDFIREFKDKVYWENISLSQKLSEDFIREFKDKLDIKKVKDNWLNKKVDIKKLIENTNKYECYDDYFIAYKMVREDRYEYNNFRYKYLDNKEYTCFSDGSCNKNGFGFELYSKNKINEYFGQCNLKVKIYYKDVTRIVKEGNKIRCSKIMIIGDLK